METKIQKAAQVQKENAIASKESGGKQQQVKMKDYLKAMEPGIAKALPSVITPERFTRIALSALSNNKDLQDSTPQSFLAALMTAAQLGLEVNTPLGHAFLIPFKNYKKGGILETQFQLGYRGLIDLAYRSGEIAIIQAQTVYSNDLFEYEYGLNPVLRHVPAKTDRGTPAYFYAMFKLKDGGYGFHVSSYEEVREHGKKYSKTFNKGPWQTNFESMALKGLALDTPIATQDGWTTMQSIQVGDIVFDMNGRPTTVVAVSDIKHLPCYEITFSGGESIVCDSEHKWLIQTTQNASRRVKTHGWDVCSADALYKLKQNNAVVVIPPIEPLVHDHVDLPVAPWTLGYWLGNGSRYHANVCCDQKDVEYISNRIRKDGYDVGAIRKDPRSNSVTIGIRSSLVTLLRETGVLQNKHIPAQYLRASIEQRKALLDGLMCSDGCIASDSRARASYTSCNKQLALQVRELVYSLGEQANFSVCSAKGYNKITQAYVVSWQPSFCPASLPRKQNNFRPRKTVKYRHIRTIKQVDSVPTKCIAVDSESKTYLAGHTMIATHNTVLKQALKYAPLKSDFVKQLAADETVKETISDSMLDIQGEYPEPEGTIEAENYTVDGSTGEVVFPEQEEK